MAILVMSNILFQQAGITLLLFQWHQAYQISLTAQPGAIPVVVRGAGVQWSCLVSDGFTHDTPILNCPSWPKSHTHKHTSILHVTWLSGTDIYVLSVKTTFASLTLVARPGVVHGS